MKQLTGDTEWTTEKCLKLLKELIFDSENYIMIDGIDECKDSVGLLQKLGDLTLSLQEVAGDCHPLYMMLSGRQDLQIFTYFTDCISISTAPETSREDEEYYVKTEIAHRQQLRPGSLFFKSSDYTSRLEGILLKKGKGLFRWIEMIIDVFEKRRFETTDDIEDLFVGLLHPQDRKEMNDEYSRLLNTLGSTNRIAATKMLKLLACHRSSFKITSSFRISDNRLTLVNLAEAMNASDASKGRANWFAEGISSILAGFVTVEFTSAAVRIAHASVIDFLTSDSAPEGDFSSEGLNSEAARLCLSSISYQQRSVFFEYSCENWYRHCRIAISNSKAPAAQKLKKLVKAFLFGDDWWTWFETWEEMSEVSIEGVEKPQRSIGFLIACHDLSGLLDPGFDDEWPYIRDMLNLTNINEVGESVLEVAIRCSRVSEVQKLLQLLPDQAAAIDKNECLILACQTRAPPERIATYLGIGASKFTWAVEEPVFHWVWGLYNASWPGQRQKSRDILVRTEPRLSNGKHGGLM